MSKNLKRKCGSEAKKSARLYQEDWFLKFGVIEKDDKVLCVNCNETIISRSYNVKRHFETNHGNLSSLPQEEKVEIFNRKLKQYKVQTSVFKSQFCPTNNITEASFHLSYCIAKHGKPLSDGEFLKESFLLCSDSLFGDFENKNSIIKRIQELPLSRNTVKDRILSLNKDVSEQLTSDLKNAEMYSISLDESTDVTGIARMAVIVRYISGNMIMEELFKLMTLKGRTTGVDCMNEVKKEFTEMNVDLKKIVSVTSDGVPSMIGKHVGFVKLLAKEVGHPLAEFHCIVHQEALWAKDIFNCFENVLSVVTKVVNFIAAHALAKRQFSNLLEEVDAQYSGLVMYNNVRWLSRGQVLERFVSLLDEIRLFLDEKQKVFPELTNLKFLNDLMFFCDFSRHFNELNTKLQGRGQIALTSYGILKAFVTKLDIFYKDLVPEKLKYFPLLKEHLLSSSYFENNFEENQKEVVKHYISVLANAKALFEERFSQFRELEKTLQFVILPHKLQFDDLKLSYFNWLNIDNLEMEMVEFQNNVVWTNKFEELNVNLGKKLQDLENCEEDALTTSTENVILTEWNSLPNSLISMKRLARSLLTFFGSTYVCEQLFSSMNLIKSKNRNRLGIDLSAACVRLKVSNIIPRISKLSSERQQQVSH